MTVKLTYVTEVIASSILVAGVLKRSELVEEETGHFPIPLDNLYHPALLTPADQVSVPTDVQQELLMPSRPISVWIP
jgi:hypothetical protein